MVSNDLGLRSRRFTIRQLDPETGYELKIKANNPAGSTDFSHRFETVSSVEAAAGSSGAQLGIGSHLDAAAGKAQADFDQLHVIVPLVMATLLVLVAIAGFAVCIKRSEFFTASIYCGSGL